MELVPSWLFATVLTLLGLLIGSFGNVVIWRVPRKESIAFPASHCPACESPIAWYDNIPVASWLVLRGRCRACAIPISSRYPLIEAASGVLFLVAALAYGVGIRALFAALLFWFLLVLSAIDIEHYRLPNPLVAALGAMGLAGAGIASLTGIPAVPLIDGTAGTVLAEPMFAALLGALIGGVLPATVAALYALIRGRQGLGMGDVKLLGVLGLFLGPFVIVVLFLGSIIGLVVGLASARGVRISETRIPFGPSLAAGAVITAIAGPSVWEWYLSVLGVR